MARNTEKTWKLRNAHCRTLNMTRKVKNVENEKDKLQDLKYEKNTEKRGK